MTEQLRRTDSIELSAYQAEKVFIKATAYACKLMEDVPRSTLGYDHSWQIHFYDYYLQRSPDDKVLQGYIAELLENIVKLYEAAGMPDELA